MDLLSLAVFVLVAAGTAAAGVQQWRWRARVLARLGRGGVGVVYRAIAADGSAVAVKVLRPELSADERFVARFRREARAARMLQGSHLASVLDAGQDGGRHYLVTQYLPGGTLRDRLAAGPMELPDIVREITDQIGLYIDQLLDPKLMVVDHFERHPALVNRIFRDFGAKELRLMVNFGFLFGFLLGIPVAIITHFVSYWWLLPLLGMVVGWTTNLLGFAVQALALHLGSVALVQPVLVTQLLFALPMAAAWQRRHPNRRDWASAALISGGLVLFLSTLLVNTLAATIVSRSRSGAGAEA